MIKQDMKMYFILVNYNSYSDTLECIKSIVESKKDCNIKTIVVDNFSPNREIQNINKVFPEVELILAKSNLGFAAANNIAIKRAYSEGADYVVLVNNDTVFTADTIQEIYSAFEKFKNADIITGKIAFWNDKSKLWYAGGDYIERKGNAIHYGFNHHVDEEMYNQSKEISFCTGCLMCMKIDTIRKHGYLAEDYFLYSEDTEYSLRVLRNGGHIMYSPNISLYHKVSASTGKYSPTSQYYMTRNRLYLISTYLKGGSRFIAYFNTMIDLLKDVLRKRGMIRYYAYAVKDFLKGKRGIRIIKNTTEA